MEKKDQELHFFVTKSDQERIHQKMAEMGIRSKSAYLRKMALDGYCVKLDLQTRLDEIWQCARELLSRLATIR